MEKTHVNDCPDVIYLNLGNWDLSFIFKCKLKEKI